MVTLKDISRETGISVTQVSRALGGHGDVNERTREKVREAARRLGYRPNAIAKGLKTGHTGFVAMVVPSDIDASGREIMFDMVVGISEQISRLGLKFLLHVVESDASVTEAFEKLHYGGGIDGFILTELKVPDARIAYLQERGIPFVVHGQDTERQHPFVDVDNDAVGRILTGRLLDAGHRRILFLNGMPGRVYTRARARGAQEAHVERGLTDVGLELSCGAMTRERGRQATLASLSRPDRPTAIIAGNMMLARGVYDAAAEAGLSIPGDLSVAAHDDMLTNYPREGFDPEPGVTRSSLREAWSALAILMSQAISGESSGPESRLTLPEFIEGSSIAAPSGPGAGD